MKITKRQSQKIFGFFRLHSLNINEHGFVFLEFAVGLPLIVVLLLSLNNLFTNSWTKCKYMIADFILQQEMESAMDRIVADARIAYDIENPELYGRLKFYQHGGLKSAKNIKNRHNDDKPWYKLSNGKIYHNWESSPITGDNILSGTYIWKFEYHQAANHPKLLYISLEAESMRSRHRFILKTEVFMRGLQNE